MRMPKLKDAHYNHLIIYFSLLLFNGFYFFETMTTPGVLLVGGLLLCRFAKIKSLSKQTCYVFLFMVLNVVFTECVAALVGGIPLQIKMTALTVINLGLALFMAAQMKIAQFKRVFVSCMIVISVVSIVGFVLYQIWPEFIKRFPALISSVGREGYFMLFTTVSDFTFVGSHRNHGIFWEPGAYQMFLALAYIFELSAEDKPARKWVLGLFLLTIVTTISTVGLIVAALLVVFTFSKVDGKLNAKRLLIILCGMIVAAMVIIPVLPPYWKYALIDKIKYLFASITSTGGNASTSTRIDAIVYPVQKFLFSPIWGIGITGYARITAETGLAMFTCTPVNWITQYGIFYGAAIYFGLWRFFNKSFSSKLECLVMLGIFLLSISTEAVQRNVLFFAMCFMGYWEEPTTGRKQAHVPHIVQINSGNIGSTGGIMLRVAEIARQEGYVCYTACPDGRSMRKKKLDDHIFIGTRIGRNVHIQLGKLTDMHGLFSIVDTWLFLNELDRIKPDIVHMHNLHNCYINLPMLFRYLRKRDIRVIWTLHDCWSFTGHCPHFDMIGCEKWKTGCNTCPQYRHYPQSIVDNSSNMYALKKKWFTGLRDLTIVTPSQWLADLTRQSFLQEYPVRVINNGIDLKVFKPVASTFKAKNNCTNRYVVLGVSFGWTDRKGLDVFVELAKRLPENYQIVLVGTNDNTDQMLPANIISIHRTQNQAELAEIYTAADVFANPTREENYPTVNMESLACGTPVITFRTGGSPEIIDETCGIVVEKDDIDAMCSGIMRICEDKPFSREACTKKAESFNKEDRFKEYINFYGKGL